MFKAKRMALNVHASSCPFLWCLSCVFGAIAVLSTKAFPSTAPFTFEEDVRPILKAACFHCHGEEHEKKAKLDVRLVRLLVEGGKSGPALVPGDAERSLVWQRIETDDMPKSEKKLPPEQKAIIRSWIEQGAPTARPEPKDVEEARFSFAELEHWAFQPVRPPPLPTAESSANPIDAFVASRLAEAQLTFSPRADRRTLIRRVTFDLTGLPPTPEDVAAFLDDTHPGAYERLVDRLLASPQFGVRWGRHWLDAVGYAESDGGPENDPRRPHAWRYRDYVINAFNANKPIDQFFLEQLAGDELIEGEPEAGNPRHLELLTATGFLRMAPDPTQTSNTLTDRNTATANAIQVIGASLTGLTIGCAQCHDHKYDPIVIDDYYRFRAIFDPVFPLQQWRQPNARLIDMTTADVRAEADRIEAEAKAQEEELQARRLALGRDILESKLADLPEEKREEARLAAETEQDKRTPEQRALLEQYPMVKPASFIAGFLVEYDNAAHRKFEEESAKIAALRATKPPFEMIMATSELPDVVPTSAVLFRGDPESPGDTVLPGELFVLNRFGRNVQLPDNDATRATTGRRLAYARRLTDGSHPLAARVFVNRLWHHHFGRGLVASPGDFGLAGERPSHPGLLDWLAADFVQNGWNAKRLHRMILCSRTYQQQSKRSPNLDSIDPDNELLARMNLRRLEAEAIRDALLTVTDRLNPALGGASIPVTVNGEGKVVLGRAKTRDGIPAGVDEVDADASRRSVFIETVRSEPLNMLATFDLPVMNPNCDARRNSTVATQSLWFMNDSAILEHAQALADLLFVDCSSDAQERVNRLFVRLFATPPTPEEQAACQEFLSAQADRFRADPDADWQARIAELPREPEVRALASLCQALLASNRFLYVD